MIDIRKLDAETAKAVHRNYVNAVNDFCFALKSPLKSYSHSVVIGTITEWENYVDDEILNGSVGFDDEAVLKCLKEAAKLSGHI
jgi:hypothetical protein